MRSVAVVANRRKILGGGLGELRKALAAAGVDAPLWYEVKRSRQAPRRVRQAVERGAELVFAWGGDGMVQRCASALAGSGVPLAILPAGTANQLATELGIPPDIQAAVDIGLHGARRALDVGEVNGEGFVVMAGVGFDGRVMRDVDGKAKQLIGRLAYLRSGLKALMGRAVRTRVRVDGKDWFKGKAGCVLLGNIGTITGGYMLFPAAQPDDGILEVGVAMAEGPGEWVRVFGRVLTGHAARSPLVHVTRGRKISVRLGRRLPYELDGGARPATDRLKIRVQPGAVTVCVPEAPPEPRALPEGPRSG